MKLTIKHEYFKLLKSNKKDIECRSAHITFIDETTGESLKRYIDRIEMMSKRISKYYCKSFPELFEADERVIVFSVRK